MDWMFRCAVLAALGALSVRAAASPVPVEAFAADPAFADPAISPDGSRLVFITWQRGKPYVMLRDLDASGPPRGLVSGESNGFYVQDCDFKTNDRLICTYRGVNHTGAGRPFWVTRMVALDADGKNVRTLVQNGRAGSAQFQDRILNWLPDDPRNVLIQIDDDKNVWPSVFKLDVFSGGLGRVMRDRLSVTRWMADRTGTIRFGFGYQDSSGEWQYLTRPTAESSWTVLERFKRRDRPFTPLGFGVRPNILFVRAPHNGRDAIWELDLDEEKDYQLLFSHPEFDVSDVILAPGGDDRVVGFSYHTDRPAVHFIDATMSNIHASLAKALPDTWNRIVDGSRDGKRFVISSYSDVKPTRWYLLEVGTGKLSMLGLQNPHLEGAALAPMKSVKIKASEDLVISGYLTVPAGKEAKNLPAIVMPHGGPYSRDRWDYDYWVQMLANRGYAVLQMNYRGSTGYGEAWLDAGWRGWGTVMHDDITSGARWLISEGISDPKRMCIVGGSYGGYAALIGIVKEPDLYRCAISIAGVSDVSRLAVDDSRFLGGRSWVNDSVGTKRAELLEISPSKQVDRIKVPVLMVHGEADSQVLVDHSKIMARELTRQGVRNELVLLEDGDHQFSRGEWRLTLLTKMEKFLAEHLGPN